jgi:hypothetical protein
MDVLKVFEELDLLVKPSQAQVSKYYFKMEEMYNIYG